MTPATKSQPLVPGIRRFTKAIDQSDSLTCGSNSLETSAKNHLARNDVALGKFKPANGEFEFRSYPFYWVMRLGNRYTHVMEAQLKKFGLNITSWRVGLILRENGALSMTEIAEHAVGRLPTITKTVYRMQESGLVEVMQNKRDGRVTMVGITRDGLDVINQVIGNTSKTIERAFDGLSQAQTVKLNKLLKQVFDNLS